MKRQFLCGALFLGALFCEMTSLRSAVADTPDPKTPAANANESIDFAISKVYPTLVRIYVVVQEPSDGRMQRGRAAGSGAIISPDGYVVTNHHVAGDAVKITCTMPDGEAIDATRVGTDPRADICVLKLKLNTRKHPEVPVPVAVWGDSSKLKLGDVVLAMGCPVAVSQSVTKGIISNLQMLMPGMAGAFRLDGEDVGQIVRWIGHDAVIFHGNSGGPLVNLQGEIVGINEIGLGSLGGAIPANLARDVVRQLIEKGHVSRSWTGLELQHRLKSDKNAKGVLVAGVIEGSPAAKAGFRGGDILTRFDGREVNAELAEHMPLVNQLVFAVPVGKAIEVAYLRDGKEHTTKVVTEELKRAQGEPTELKDWGLAVRDMTRMMALERHRKDHMGVLVESTRGGGGAATAKLPLQPNDVILRVNDQEVADSAALKKVTDAVTDGKTERVPVLVLFERDTKQLLTVVKIGRDEEEDRPAYASKPWSAMQTQVLTADLAEQLDMKARHGVRVTEVFKRQAADKAGVKVGDIVLAVNGQPIFASQPGDTEVFDTMIRRLSVGGKATLKIVRNGKPTDIAMTLESPPLSDENAKTMSDQDIEIGARELSYNERVKNRIPEDLPGVQLTKVENGGVASLGGLRGGDFLMSVDGKTTPTVAELKSVLEDIRQKKPRRVVFYVRRGIHTLFCEVEPDYR